MPRFKKKAKIFDIAITAVAGMVSVGVMLYAVFISECGKHGPNWYSTYFTSPAW